MNTRLYCMHDWYDRLLNNAMEKDDEQHQHVLHDSKNTNSESELETLLCCDIKLTGWPVRLSHLLSLNPLFFKNISYVGSFKKFVFVFVFVFVFKWTVEMSQRALQPIYINTGLLEFLVSLSLYLSLRVYYEVMKKCSDVVLCWPTPQESNKEM